jgi:hypothetical protein
VKSLQVLHPSFAVYAGVLVAALVVIGGLVVTSRGAHGHLIRLGKCAMAGVIAAAALVVFVNSKKHAQLAAAAARSVNGHRQSVTYLLTDAFVFTAVLVTVTLFAVVTLVARRRQAPVFGRPAHRRPVRTGWPE